MKKNKYVGVIIEESLADKRALKDLKIISTEVEKVTPKHQSSEKQWTLQTVEIPETEAANIAENLSKALKAGWYADFKNDEYHYIIFRNRVFFIDRTSKEEYDQAKRYGILQGIPEHQVDFGEFELKS